VFHLLFLKLFPLGRFGWKVADYVWLGAAAIGLLTATTDVRQIFAPTAVEWSEWRRNRAYEELRHEVEFLSGSAVCRTFIRTEFSPANLTEMQAEFDRVCERFGEMLSTLPQIPPESLNENELRDRPPVEDTILLDLYGDLDAAIVRFSEAKRVLAESRESVRRTGLEISLVATAPILLALALALRVTKVSGELRLDRLAQADSAAIGKKIELDRAASQSGDTDAPA
jgi:hypothetical protein